MWPRARGRHSFRARGRKPPGLTIAQSRVKWPFSASGRGREGRCVRARAGAVASNELRFSTKRQRPRNTTPAGAHRRGALHIPVPTTCAGAGAWNEVIVVLSAAECPRWFPVEGGWAAADVSPNFPVDSKSRQRRCVSQRVAAERHPARTKVTVTLSSRSSSGPTAANREKESFRGEPHRSN